jgi:hypothetical protein
MSALCQRVDLFHRVLLLIVCFSICSPVHEVLMVRFPNAWDHHYIQRRVDDLLFRVLKYTGEMLADFQYNCLLLITFRVNKACVLLKKHFRVK